MKKYRITYELCAEIEASDFDNANEIAGQLWYGYDDMNYCDINPSMEPDNIKVEEIKGDI